MGTRGMKIVHGSLMMIAGGFAWGLPQFAGYWTRNIRVYDPESFLAPTLLLAINGLAIGTLVGLSHWLTAKLFGKEPARRVAVSLVSFVIALPVGYFLVGMMVFVNSTRLGLLSTNGNGYIIVPVLLQMMASGGIAGAITWLQLRNGDHSGGRSISDGLLWSLLSVLGWTLGFASSNIGAMSELPLHYQSAVAGSVIVTIDFIATEFRDVTVMISEQTHKRYSEG